MDSKDSTRVMHVIASLNGYGAEHFVLDLLPLLAASGANVAALTVYVSGARPAGRNGDFEIFDAARTGRMDLAFFPRMVRAMRRFRPDVVHTHMHNGKYWGRLAALAAGVPHIVHTEHDPSFSGPRIERAAAALLARRTSRFVAFSPGHRLRLARAESIPLGKIAVIPNGITFRTPRPDARERGRRLLGAAAGERAVVMVGRLEHQKNHELALRAFAQLPASLLADTRLHLIGAGSLDGALRTLVQELGLSDRVSFLGFRADALDVVSGADVLLMTSHREAMPIALIESMSIGVPVVSAPWDGADEMLDGGALGYVATSFAPDAVGQALAQALRDPAQARTKADGARTKALLEYDIRTAAHRHVDLYRSLVGAS
jgi:glycosyltransferase involved in cell wall biosynthesis